MRNTFARNILRFGIAFALVVFSTGAFPVQAHEIEGLAGGFASGFMHPLNGPDHMAAMVAVGLWGAVLGLPAIWLLPILFPLVMAFGGVLGIIGVSLPYVEVAISLSAITLGLAVLFSYKPSLWVAGCLVALFAIFHGHAHGTELPEAAHALGYSAGFVLATGFLHLCGILLGILTGVPGGDWLVRLGGALITLTGLYFLYFQYSLHCC